MSSLEAVGLGVIQGLTEFLPVSSTAHLRIVPALFGREDPGAAFTAVTQLGTMLAVLIYFRRDLTRILVTWTRSLRSPALRGELDARMGWYIGLGTIPIGVFGLAFKDQIEGGARNLYVIGTALVVLGLVLGIAERVGSRDRPLASMGTGDAVAIGMAQACALVPGVSRSGATLSVGLFRGLERPAAARYSFLLSVPAIVLSGLLELPEIGAGDGPGVATTALATVVAFLSGYAAIAWLLRFLATHSTNAFVVYRLVLGALVLALTASGTIS
ncbi:MAG TPA: undecaprenyl-diphosphate phosphatase [Mycobacteriales bacterium]|nr:undecaprenyl-diphosphate phosphatase [Mycobacteriales bacterium]